MCRAADQARTALGPIAAAAHSAPVVPSLALDAAGDGIARAIDVAACGSRAPPQILRRSV